MCVFVRGGDDVGGVCVCGEACLNVLHDWVCVWKLLIVCVSKSEQKQHAERRKEGLRAIDSL